MRPLPAAWELEEPPPATGWPKAEAIVAPGSCAWEVRFDLLDLCGFAGGGKLLCGILVPPTLPPDESIGGKTNVLLLKVLFERIHGWLLMEIES